MFVNSNMNILIVLLVVFILFFVYLIKKQMEKFISLDVMEEPRCESADFKFVDVSDQFKDKFLRDVDEIWMKKCDYKGGDIYDFTSVHSSS